MAELTHTYLSDIAKRWLLRSHSAKGAGCNVAFIEVGGLFSGERADAWGYRWSGNGGCGSVLVEVKISRSDFLADAKKPHRNGDVIGMGNYRYYMCPEEIIQPEELPKNWGLIWVNKRGHAKVICGHAAEINNYQSRKHFHEWMHEANTILEMDMMAHLLSRIGDPEKMNRIFRDKHAENQMLWKRLQNQSNHMKEMRWKLSLAQLKKEINND